MYVDYEKGMGRLSNNDWGRRINEEGGNDR